jgi:hypothetical protein
MKSLPAEGRVTKLKESQQRKLDSLGVVLQLHQRQSVYEFAVYESAPKPFAFIGLHQRVVLLISDVALSSLDTAELQASTAHEIGHEYVWAENLDAVKRNDDRRLKELELICDGIAILTLRRAGIDPMALLTAAEKIAKFNALSTGPSANAHRYPSREERQKFAQAIMTWADSQRSTHIRIERQPTGVPHRPVKASSSDGGDPFIAAIETAKRSVASLDCPSVNGSQSRIPERVGGPFLLSGGDFLAAAHVIAGMQNPEGSCPTPALTLPAGDWRPEARTEDMNWLPFQASSPAERTVTVYALDNGLNTPGAFCQAQQRSVTEKSDGRPKDSKMAKADTKNAKLSLTAYVRASFGDSGSVPIVMLAQGIASRMFATAGVQINWRTGLAKTSESEPILIDITSNTPKEFHQGALAYAQVFEGAHIRVFYDRVVNAYRPGAAMLLAHVLVHEITHILEGLDRHSEAGVLKAQWTADDLVQMVYSPLPFDPEDVLLTRKGLAIRDRAASRTRNLSLERGDRSK